MVGNEKEEKKDDVNDLMILRISCLHEFSLFGKKQYEVMYILNRKIHLHREIFGKHFCDVCMMDITGLSRED